MKNAGVGVDVLECAVQCAAIGADEQRARARRQLNLANLALTESGEQATMLLARAEALAQLDRPHEAGQVYRRAIDLALSGSSEMLEAYYGLLTAMDADPMAAERQIATCLEALEIFPLDSQLLCGMGSYLLRFGRLDLAARSYEMAVVHGRVDPATWHLADLADVAVVCWSLVLQLTGDAKQAEAVLESALADRPDSLRLRRQLIELQIKTGRERKALAQCKSLPEEMPFRADARRGTWRDIGGSKEIGGRARAPAIRVPGGVPRSAMPALVGGGTTRPWKPHGRRGHCGRVGTGRPGQFGNCRISPGSGPAPAGRPIHATCRQAREPRPTLDDARPIDSVQYASGLAFRAASTRAVPAALRFLTNERLRCIRSACGRPTGADRISPRVACSRTIEHWRSQ